MAFFTCSNYSQTLPHLTKVDPNLFQITSAKIDNFQGEIDIIQCNKCSRWETKLGLNSTQSPPKALDHCEPRIFTDLSFSFIVSIRQGYYLNLSDNLPGPDHSLGTELRSRCAPTWNSSLITCSGAQDFG